MIRVVSCHIPKTAGTSFLEVLRSVYGEEFVFRDYGDRPSSGGSIYNKDHGVWEKKKRKEDIKSLSSGNFKCVHGHFILNKYLGEFPEAKRIAWIRDPVTRVVSHYFHSKKRNQSLTIEQLISDRYLQNQMVRFLGTVDPSDLDFIGISEMFDQEVERAAKQFGWKRNQWHRASKIKRNRNTQTTYKNYRLPENVYSKIRELNRLDDELYSNVLDSKVLNSYYYTG